VGEREPRRGCWNSAIWKNSNSLRSTPSSSFAAAQNSGSLPLASTYLASAIPPAKLNPPLESNLFSVILSAYLNNAGDLC
jgi:hypothetical protein